MEKTAVGGLIEYFEQQLRLQRSSEIKYTTEEALVDAIDVCKNTQRTIEKKQIMDAHDNGISRYCQWEPERHGNEQPSGKNYYEKTYSTPPSS